MGRILLGLKRVWGSWDDMMQEFVWFKQAQGLSETTLADYRKHISRFFHRHPESNPESVKACVMEYMGQRVAPATFNLRLTYLHAFFEWCVKESLLKVNPLVGIKHRKAEGRTVRIDKEVLVHLITLPNRATFAGVRDYALILLTLDTGIRPKEAASILKENVNLHAGEVYVESHVSKTRTARTLPISVLTCQAIKRLIDSRHPLWSDKIPVFCTCDGRRFADFTWRDRLKKYGETLGVKIRPYDLRHCFALYFLRNGGNVFALQKFLGHIDLTMTKRYVNLVQQDLREQHDLASPLNVLLPVRNRMRKAEK